MDAIKDIGVVKPKPGEIKDKRNDCNYDSTFNISSHIATNRPKEWH